MLRALASDVCPFQFATYSVCELVLNLLRDRLIWGCFTWVRYGSIWISVLNSLLYVLKIGLATEFCFELYQWSIYVEYIFSLIWLINPDRSVCCLSQSAPWPYILRMFCIFTTPRGVPFSMETIQFIIYTFNDTGWLHCQNSVPVFDYI